MVIHEIECCESQDTDPLTPKPFPEAKLIAPDELPPPGMQVWIYEGTLERFASGHERYHYAQRIAWPAEPSWEQVRELGLWMAERLSINGHLLLGLRARAEDNPAVEARLISPES